MREDKFHAYIVKKRKSYASTRRNAGDSGKPKRYNWRSKNTH